jgi:phosphoesterase RecJ-like protein
MNWQDISSRLKPGQDVMVFVHEKPDGDAWGSAFGLGLIFESLGYNPKLVRPFLNISKTFSWLPGQHLNVGIPSEELHIPPDTAVVVLDCGDLARCEYAVSPEDVLLNVDHHVGNNRYGEINWLDPEAGATAQILCRMLLAKGIKLPAEAATCFYYALVTDTGGFRFSNTNAETMKIASVLLEAGADLGLIREHLWENRPSKELTLLHEMLNAKILVADGRGVICPINNDLVEGTDIYDAETDTSLEMIRGIEGVEAVMLLKETEPGLIKLSLRTKNILDSAAFMSRLGGGGHIRAAGATLHESLDDVIDKVKVLLTEALTKPYST